MRASASSSVRFIHSSDWQLGMTRTFLSEEASARFSQDRIGAIARLGGLAREHGAGFIIVAGDVFESNQLSRQTLMRALDALDALPVPVFLLPGNHDPLDGTSIFRTRDFTNTANHIIVLQDTTPAAVPGLPGVEVAGAPWKSKHPASDLCRELTDSLEPAQGVIRIALAHGQVDVLSPDPSQPDCIDLAYAEHALAQKKYHYLGLGDRHSTTRVGDSGRIWYSGTPVATGFDEQDPNQALLVEVDAAGKCDVQPLRVGNWSFLSEQRAMNGPRDLEEFDSWLSALENKECTAVRVGFRGSVNLSTASALHTLMEIRSDLFASLRFRQRTSELAVAPDQLDQDSVDLLGYARETWNELLSRAESGDTVARDALMLMYRLGTRDGA